MTDSEISSQNGGWAQPTADWLAAAGLRNDRRAAGAFREISQQGIPGDLLQSLWDGLGRHLAETSAPDRVLDNLRRFFDASRSPLSLAAMFERDAESLPVLLKVFSTSQYLAELLIADPDAFDVVRLTDGQPIERQYLIDTVCSDVAAATDDTTAARALRLFKRRETLRIAYGDFVCSLPFERVVQQISWVADAILTAALQHAVKSVARKRPELAAAAGSAKQLAVLALGKLGGVELNYSSDIDLVLVHATPGSTSTEPRALAAHEYHDAVAQRFVQLITQKNELGMAYRLDLRLRPHGGSGPLVIADEDALRYYDLNGRTWERQAFIKARAVAGDIETGQRFLERLQTWIFQPYLNRADISGIAAIKRKIERQSVRHGKEESNVKIGHGGIRDIEYAIQFLQLLSGHDEPRLRSGNTLAAISALESVGSLTMQERSLLSDNYIFLRRIEHCLQIMGDLQTHDIPSDDEEQQQLAWRLGYRAGKTGDAKAFLADLDQRRKINRRILDHILHSAFPDDSPAAPETDLILDPDPDLDAATGLMAEYGFQAPRQAFFNLLDLSRETIPFLSTRRCRFFLSVIAPPLLKEIGATPDPDQTLTNLCRVADSLGGKGVLWELLHSIPPTLKMFVRLCAAGIYLVDILTGSPGMIDELMDALVLNRPPRFDELRATAHALCTGAEDIDPILQNFKRMAHLRIGILDILGKESIRDTHRCLSDTAEVCLGETIDFELEQLFSKYGRPVVWDGSPSHLVVLALGKLGGREPNYHSDLDVVFIYLGDGETRPVSGGRRDNTTSNSHFYNQLAQRVTKRIAGVGAYGRLYELDTRLRPSGRSGVLALSLEQFIEYFSTSSSQMWEHLALCKGRPVYGHEHAAATVMEAVQAILQRGGWDASSVQAIRDVRRALEQSASKTNLKRAPGGTIDVEFIAQMLQLKHASHNPGILTPGTLDALQVLAKNNLLDKEAARQLSDNYLLLRRVESGLRLLNTTARHDLPDDPPDLLKLAYLLQWDRPESIADACAAARESNRAFFDRLLV